MFGLLGKKRVCDCCGRAFRGDGLEMRRADNEVIRVCGPGCEQTENEAAAEQRAQWKAESAKRHAERKAHVETLIADGAYTLLTADYTEGRSLEVVNRVGGLPIGFTDESWPRDGDAPLLHLLTLDLRGQPFGVQLDAAALAVFVYAELFDDYWEVQEPYRVVLLTEADLALGEPAATDETLPTDALTPGLLGLEPASRQLTPKELFNRCFGGGVPIWLQGEPTEHEYWEAGEWPLETFVAQIDASIFQGPSADGLFGDGGYLYVHTNAAFIQCY